MPVSNKLGTRIMPNKKNDSQLIFSPGLSKQTSASTAKLLSSATSGGNQQLHLHSNNKSSKVLTRFTEPEMPNSGSLTKHQKAALQHKFGGTTGPRPASASVTSADRQYYRQQRSESGSNRRIIKPVLCDSGRREFNQNREDALKEYFVAKESGQQQLRP